MKKLFQIIRIVLLAILNLAGAFALFSSIMSAIYFAQKGMYNTFDTLRLVFFAIVELILILLLVKRIKKFKSMEPTEHELEAKAKKVAMAAAKAEEEKKAQALASAQRVEEKNKAYEEYRKQQDIIEAKQKELELEKKAILESEKAPSGEVIDTIYKVKEEGSEASLGTCLKVIGVLLFAGAIFVGVESPLLKGDNAGAMLALLTVVAWALLILFYGLGHYFSGMFFEARLRTFVKSKSGAVYCCDLLPRYSNTSFNVIKVVRLYKNVKAKNENEALLNKSLAYYKSDEYDKQLASLVETGKADIPMAYNFMYLPNAQITKRGMFTNRLSFVQMGQPCELRVHKNFKLEV